MRGTFANIRLRNQLVPGRRGRLDAPLPRRRADERSTTPPMRYQDEGVPLVVIAGKEYGTGSSRDWAAKGTKLLGVRAVIAESYERIHRSNLVGMGVLPLQFLPGQSRETLGLRGDEVYDVRGIADARAAGSACAVRGDAAPTASTTRFEVDRRIDTPVEVDYYRNGGILQTVLRGMAGRA